MEKKKKIQRIVIAVIVIFVVFLIAKAWMAKRNNTKTTGTTTSGSNSYSGSTGGTTSGATSPAGCTNSTVLKKGTKCDRVQWTQNAINGVRSRLGTNYLTEDSIFGTKTEAAVKALLGKTTATWTEVKEKTNQIKAYM